LRRLSAIFNKAIEWGWEGKNPTKGVKKFKEVTRDRFILPNEMPYFQRAIELEENQTCKDFILILLLTGARKTNTLDMAWNDINWDLREWRIPETKNGEPLKLPLHESTLAILKRRKSTSNSKWVFAQENNPTKRIIDPTKSWYRIRGTATLLMWNDDKKTAIWLKDSMKTVRSYLSPHLKVIRLTKLAEAQGFPLPGSLLDIRLHDIRRTFGSYQALTGASLQIIGKSLGHKSPKTTQIYSRLNLDPVRDSMNKAVSQMFST
jgi:integrase